MIDTRAIRLRWEAAGSMRDERGKRLFAASEARAAPPASGKIVAVVSAGFLRGLRERAPEKPELTMRMGARGYMVVSGNP
jgi:hypothetical protein